jgi:hypothetical protein
MKRRLEGGPGPGGRGANFIDLLSLVKDGDNFIEDAFFVKKKCT